MKLPPVIAPKRPAWMLWTAGIAVLSVLAYVGINWLQPWRPGRLWGLVFGTIAGLLFLNAGLYPARRRVRAWPLGTAQRWLQLHIYGTVLATLFVFIHVGFTLPAGAMGWWLLGLSLWTSGTGLVGVFLQKWIPILVARSVRVEAIYERIPELRQQLVTEADALMGDAPEMLTRTYNSQLRAFLETPRPRLGYLANAALSRDAVLEPVTKLSSFADAADRERIKDLESIVLDKIDLDVHLTVQRALRVWLMAHVPAAMLLLALLAVHVIVVLYF